MKLKGRNVDRIPVHERETIIVPRINLVSERERDNITVTMPMNEYKARQRYTQSLKDEMLDLKAKIEELMDKE